MRISELLYRNDDATKGNCTDPKLDFRPTRFGDALDSGPGIPLNDRLRIFDRFSRGKGARGDGAGLGLAIVMEIVRAHGASIAVSDCTPCGARFDLRFRPA